jgi:hypothetical protein
MFKNEAQEGSLIMQRALYNLLSVVPTAGLTGSTTKAACRSLAYNAEKLLYLDQAGPPLSNCFELARREGVTQPQLEWLRKQVELEAPVTTGATMVQNSIMWMCLVTEGRVIANMSFTSRSDVDALKITINGIFADAEETAADEMDQMSYRGLVELHANIIAFLVKSARPLPMMLQFAFYSSMPTLVMANRLYYDASRADELRDENKVVHPAFMLPTGRALSA